MRLLTVVALACSSSHEPAGLQGGTPSSKEKAASAYTTDNKDHVLGIPSPWELPLSMLGSPPGPSSSPAHHCIFSAFPKYISLVKLQLVAP